MRMSMQVGLSFGSSMSSLCLIHLRSSARSRCLVVSVAPELELVIGRQPKSAFAVNALKPMRLSANKNVCFSLVIGLGKAPRCGVNFGGFETIPAALFR